MSYDSLLVNSISVYRPVASYSKGRSTVTYPATANYSNIPCNIQFVLGAGVAGGTREVTEHGFETAGGWWGFFKYGANILKDDKIIDEDGRCFVVLSVPLDIVGKGHHIEVRLSVVE